MAFEEIYRKTDHPPQLILAGPTGWLSDDLFTHVAHSAVKDRILLAGYVGDLDLRALHRIWKPCGVKTSGNNLKYRLPNEHWIVAAPGRTAFSHFVSLPTY